MGDKAPKSLGESLSMGSAQCYPHFLLIDEASIVLSLLPQMPLNQHFQMRNPGPKDLLAYWLQCENQNAGPPTSKLSLISVSCQPHRKSHSGQTQACHLMCPCSLLRVPTGWVSAVLRTRPRTVFLDTSICQSLGFSLYSPCHRGVPSILCFGCGP